ncbi:DUF2634 domain-containing protein [Eubacterium limosum]|uniref:DUF2634 domain-containing protein n=1 Tax=Eubacterium limosum TaxID=1736 RepID=UPI001D09657A|nr:DUF2634 domain-containing protein [Eubacterium limosum]MCB6569975.1 DUF2634 domain-containing protein [Eubacterium limosum]
MANLFPEFKVPDMAPAQEVSSKNQNVRSFYFDYKKGDFLLDNTGKVPLAEPVDTWIQWCVKALATERFAFRSYSTEYGAEYQPTMSMEQKACENWIERTISETLLADPLQRTAFVKDFSYSHYSDCLFVTFMVCGQDGMEATLSKKIGGEG